MSHALTGGENPHNPPPQQTSSHPHKLSSRHASILDLKKGFDPNPCLLFPTILVSLIKETASVHKSCFSGGYHCNICCHKPLGIHRSLSQSFSQKDEKKKKSDETLSCCRAIFLCKTAVSGIATLA